MLRMSRPKVKVEVRLIDGDMYGMDPDKPYLIVFDPKNFVIEDITKIQDELARMGIEDVLCIVGDPNGVKVIEGVIKNAKT